MATYTLPQYRILQQKRIASLQKSKPRSEVWAAELTAAKARLYAPRKTGRLLRGIVRRGNEVSARASNNGFPYIHWVNATRGMGYTTLRMRRGIGGQFVSRRAESGVVARGRPKAGQSAFTAIYGVSPNWRWTGQKHFFSRAVEETRKYWADYNLKVLRKSLRGEAI